MSEVRTFPFLRLSFILILCTFSVESFAQNLGFENTNGSTPWGNFSAAQWSYNNSFTTIEACETWSNSQYIRTGAGAVLIDPSSGSAYNQWTSSNASVTIPASGNFYVHMIAYARQSNNGKCETSLGVFVNSSWLWSSNVTPSNTAFTKLTYDLAAQNSTTYAPCFRSRQKSSGSDKTGIDDIFIYYDQNAATDQTAPSAASNFAVSKSNGNVTIAFNEGADNSGGSGLDGYLVLRATDAASTLPVVNNQGMYNAANTNIGPAELIVSSPYTLWEVVYNGAANGGTFTDYTADNSYTYLVYMRDKAWNYSAPKRVLVVNENGAQLQASTTFDHVAQFGGTFYILSGNTCTLSSGAKINSASGVLVNDGLLSIPDGSLLDLDSLSNNSGTITISNGATVNVSGGSYHNRGTINLASGGTINMGGNFSIVNGTLNVYGGWEVAGDLHNNTGTLNNYNLLEIYGSMSNISGTYNIESGGLLNCRDFDNGRGYVYVKNNGTFTIAGDYVNQWGASLVTVYNGGKLELLAAATITNELGEFIFNTGCNAIINGTFINKSDISVGNPSNVTFTNGSIFKHQRYSGSIIPATWGAGSTCELDGVGWGNLPTNLHQNFCHFIWDWQQQPNDFNLNGALMSLTGTFYVKSTNGRLLVMESKNSISPVFSWGGFTITGGRLVGVSSSSSIPTFNINGDVNIAGGYFYPTNSTSTGNCILNIDGGLVVSGSGDFRAYGGTGTSSSYLTTINFTNNSSQNNSSVLKLPTALAYNSSALWRINVNAGRFITLQSDIVLGGTNATNNCCVTVKTGGTLYCGNYSIRPLTSALNTAFVMQTGSTLGIGSSIGIIGGQTPSGNIQTHARSYAATATFVYNGSSQQFIGNGLPTSVATLMIDNSGGVVMQGNVEVTSQLNIVSGTLSIGDHTLTLNDTVSGSGTVSGSSLANLIIKGSDNSGTIRFTPGFSVLKNLQMNKSSNGEIVLGSDLVVNGNLDLTRGWINLSSNELLLGLNATVTNANSNSYVRISDTAGKLTRVMDSQAKLFPVGHNPYLPVVITCPNCSGTETFDVQVFDHLYENPMGNTGQVFNNAVLKTWAVQSSIPQNDVNITFQWNTAEQNGLGGLAGVSYFENMVSNGWNTLGTTPVGGSGPFSITTASPLDMSVNTYYLAVANMFSPVPVELLDFHAVPGNGSVQLGWTTAMELNNEFFTIEKSRDGVTFTEVSRVSGAGNSNRVLNYRSTDAEPFPGLSYYRLKQTDHNGDFTYSKTVLVKFRSSAVIGEMNVIPNPFTENAFINFNSGADGNMQLTIVDMTGRLVRKETIPAKKGSNSLQLLTGAQELPAGIYLLNLQLNEQRMVYRFVKN
jgi:hypothetical protein